MALGSSASVSSFLSSSELSFQTTRSEFCELSTFTSIEKDTGKLLRWILCIWRATVWVSVRQSVSTYWRREEGLERHTWQANDSLHCDGSWRWIECHWITMFSLINAKATLFNKKWKLCSVSVRLVCHKFEQKKESVVSTSSKIWCVRKMAQNLVDSFFCVRWRCWRRQESGPQHQSHLQRRIDMSFGDFTDIRVSHIVYMAVQ